MRKKLLALTLIALLLLPGGSAEPSEPVDGTLRVYLLSLGNIASIDFTLDGVYTVNGSSGFRLDKGTTFTLALVNGSIYLLSGGLTIQMGESFQLTRAQTEEGAANGAYLSKTERDTLYCGDFIIRAGANGLEITLIIDIEDYLYGVVPYEMSDSFPLEALKAQAVAARTYAYRSKLSSANETYDVVDTTQDQVFKGYDPSFTNAIQAVDETRGVMGAYQGEYVMCWYSASNGGQTLLPQYIWGGDGDYGYVDIRDDPYDLENPQSVVKTLTIATDGAQLDERLRAIFLPQLSEQLAALGYSGEESEIQITRVLRVEALDPLYEGTRMYTRLRFSLEVAARASAESALPTASPAESLAPAPSATPVSALNLFSSFFQTDSATDAPTPSPTPAVSPSPSPAETAADETGEIWVKVPHELTADVMVYSELKDGFDMAINGGDYELVSVVNESDTIRIEMRRFGHGVGMSQRGAQWMAAQYGMTYTDILSFYYPGMELVTVTWAETPLGVVDPLPLAPEPTQAPLPALESGEAYARVTLSSRNSTLNVRAEPHTDAAIVGTLAHDWRLIVISTADGWAQIRTADLSGYVSLDYIEFE